MEEEDKWYFKSTHFTFSFFFIFFHNLFRSIVYANTFATFCATKWERNLPLGQSILSAAPIPNSKKILQRNKCRASFKDLYPPGYLEMIQRKGMARSPLAPLYQNCHCWNPSPDNKPNCPTFKKRICINQSLIAALSNKIQARVKELGIVQIYISVVFPVISRLLGSRAQPPPFSQFRPRLNGKYSLFEWKCRKRRFSAECIWLQTVATRAGFTENVSPFVSFLSQKSAFIFFAGLFKEKCIHKAKMSKEKPNQNTQSSSVVSVAAV